VKKYTRTGRGGGTVIRKGKRIPAVGNIWGKIKNESGQLKGKRKKGGAQEDFKAQGVRKENVTERIRIQKTG